MWSKPYLMYLWFGTHGVSHQNGFLVVTALNCAHGLLYCAHGLLYCAHGLLYCAHGLLYRAHGLLYRAHGLLYCAHGLLYCAHGLLYRAHGLLYCAHGLLYCAHRLFLKLLCPLPGSEGHRLSSYIVIHQVTLGVVCKTFVILTTLKIFLSKPWRSSNFYSLKL